MNTRILFSVGLLAMGAILLYVFVGSDQTGLRSSAPSGRPSAPTVSADDGVLLEVEALQQPESEHELSSEQAKSSRTIVSTPLAPTWPAAETRWIEVQLLAPAETPRAEAAWIVALSKSADNAELHHRDGPFEQLHAGKDPARIEGLLGATQLAAGQTARIGLPPSADETWLAVGGSYLYSLTCQRVSLLDAQAPIELRPVLGAWISGRLLAPPAQPKQDLAKQEVKLRWSVKANLQLGAATTETLRRSLLTDSMGRFEFRAVPLGKPQVLIAESESLAMAFRDDFTPRAGEHLQLDLALQLGGKVTGRLLDPSGAIISGAELHALGQIFAGNPTARLRETKSDEQGRFELLGITQGLVVVRSRHEGFKDLMTPPFEMFDAQTYDLGDLVMVEGLVLSGTVLFPDGKPATGALVRVDPDLSENLGGTPMDETAFIGAGNQAQVDESGAFRIKGTGPGPWSVSARLELAEHIDAENDDQSAALPGLWTATQGAVRAPREDLNFVLLAPIHVEGLVLDGAGQPVVSFEIQGLRAGTQWYMPPSENRTQTFQDDQGRFRLSNLRSGDWTFSARSPGFANSVEIKQTLPDGSPLEFKLLRPVRLAGQVVDPDGRPLGGAEVSQELVGTQVFEAMQGRGDWPTAKSDAEGNFSLEGLAPGAGSVLAKKSGFAPSAAIPFDAAEGQEITDLVLKVRRGAILTGEVFEADGKPAGGCMLIVQMPTMAERRITNTQPDGRFEEAGMTPGQWQVQAFPGISSLQSESGEALDQATLIAALKMTMVLLEDEQTTHVVLGQPPASPVLVSGRVKAGDVPIAGAMISFVPSKGAGMEQLKITQLDEDGRYSVRVDEAGDYLVTIQIIENMGRQNSLEYQRSVPQAEAHSLDFELPLGRISGRVRGPDGRARAAARVTLNMQGGLVFGTVFGGQYNETVTNEEGEFEIPYLRPGSYAVAAGGAQLGGFLGAAEGLGRVVTSVHIEEGQWRRDLDFTLEEPGAIHGTVRDSGGALVSAASIFIRDSKGHLLELFSFAETNASGSFEYPALAPGDYTVIARSPSMTSSSGTPVRVRAGESSEVTVSVTAGTVLLVTLSDKSGSDIASRVSVLDSAGRELNGMLGMTEIMARYNGGTGSSVQRVGPVPPGSYTIWAYAADGRSTKRNVTLKGQEEHKVKLRLN